MSKAAESVGVRLSYAFLNSPEGFERTMAGIIRDRLTCLPARGGSAALTVGGGLLVDDWLSAGRRAVSAVPATTSVRFTAGHIGRAPLVATKEH